MKYLIVALLLTGCRDRLDLCPLITESDIGAQRQIEELPWIKMDGVDCSVHHVVERNNCVAIPGRDFSPACEGTIVRCTKKL